jgi:uncharacterized protein YydD (DUF2326 family)
MIRRLSANRPEFRPIEFKAGFNAIVADQAPDASETDSRNARGKTTTLLVINYLLGGNLPRQLRPLADEGWAFTLSLDFLGHEVEVTRALKGGTRLEIRFPVELEAALGDYVSEGRIHVDDWKALLGLALFRLEPTDTEGSYSLSPRMLLSYVVRIDPGRDPLRAFPQQPAWSSRQHVAFMFSLDWQVVRRLQKINRDSETLAAVALATQELDLPSFRDESELVLERLAVQRELEAAGRRARGFQVLEDPDGLVRIADELTAEMSALRDQALVDRRMETLYREALSEDSDGSSERVRVDVQGVYEAVGQAFSTLALRRLSEVEAFHDRLMENRRTFLARELDDIAARTSDRNAQLAALSTRRQAVMRQLQAGGALEELLALQAEVSRLEAQMSQIEHGLRQVREVADASEELRLQRAMERQHAQKQLARDRAKLDRIAARFDAKLRLLYGVSGVLTAEVDDDGYLFRVRVSGGASSGVNRMQLLCFDLTLLEEGVESGHHPDFLIHDSSVFDGVDPRQRAAALSLCHQTVSNTGGQYICTLNSNDVPEDVVKEPWFVEGTVRTVLDTEEGGILGVPF